MEIRTCDLGIYKVKKTKQNKKVSHYEEEKTFKILR